MAVCRSGYYQLRQLQPIARSLSVEAAKSLVQAFISSRLDYCNAILHGLPDRLMRRHAIGTERCRTADNWCTTVRPHHTDTATAPLATSTTTCRLQDRRPGFPVLDWAGTWLPGRRLSARSPTSISRHSDLCHAPHVQHLRRPMLRSCRSTAMELGDSLPINLRQCHGLEFFQAFVKDIPV